LGEIAEYVIKIVAKSAKTLDKSFLDMMYFVICGGWIF